MIRDSNPFPPSLSGSNLPSVHPTAAQGFLRRLTGGRVLLSSQETKPRPLLFLFLYPEKDLWTLLFVSCPEVIFK